MKKILSIYCLFLFSAPAWAAYAFLDGVASTQSGSMTSTCPVTLTGTNVGDLIIYAADAFVQTPTAPTDGTNTYTQIKLDISVGGNHQGSYYTINATSGSLTITGGNVGSVGTFWGCGALRFSFSGSFTINTGVSAGYTNVFSFDSGSATIASGSLRIGYAGINNSATCTAGSGWTMGAQNGDGGQYWCMEYDVSAAGGSQNATMSTDNQVSGVIAEVALSPPSNRHKVIDAQ